MYSTADKPIFHVPSSTEWMEQNGRKRDARPIEPAYNPRKDLGWGMVCIVAFLGIVLAFAAMTPGA